MSLRKNARVNMSARSATARVRRLGLLTIFEDQTGKVISLRKASEDCSKFSSALE